MQIKNPNVELIEQGENLVSHVARCARVCYKREKGNNEVTYNNLLKNKHWSMFRHATYYFIIPNNCVPRWIIIYFNAIIRGAKIIGIDISYVQENYYIVTNGNWNLDHQNLLEYINDYAVTAKEFTNANETAWNMMRYTFKITTQISTSRELNRVSPNNIAEQSTRYVYEDGTICRPHWMTEYEANYLNSKEILDDDWLNNHTWAKRYIWTINNSFDKYRMFVDCLKMLRQDARGVLPLDTATECVYTYSIPEWRHIIELRADVKRAHPNAVIIANMIKKELNGLGYDI